MSDHDLKCINGNDTLAFCVNKKILNTIKQNKVAPILNNVIFIFS